MAPRVGGGGVRPHRGSGRVARRITERPPRRRRRSGYGAATVGPGPLWSMATLSRWSRPAASESGPNAGACSPVATGGRAVWSRGAALWGVCGRGASTRRLRYAPFPLRSFLLARGWHAWRRRRRGAKGRGGDGPRSSRARRTEARGVLGTGLRRHTAISAGADVGERARPSECEFALRNRPSMRGGTGFVHEQAREGRSGISPRRAQAAGPKER